MPLLAPSIITALRQAIGPGPLKLHEPRFNGNESRYVQDCIASTFVSSVGQYVDRFEADLASYTGARHTGTFGRLGVLSFNGNKIITTGGGGAILTDDE